MDGNQNNRNGRVEDGKLLGGLSDEKKKLERVKKTVGGSIPVKRLTKV